MKTKKCSKCEQELSVNEFCSDKKSKDGKQSQCKKCKTYQLVLYYKKNPHKKSKRTKQDNKKRYENNKISMNFSRRMRKTLNELKDSRSWEMLVGYTVFELKEHLEKLFKPGMSWDNYGLWHIDHIIPITKFNITSIYCDDFKKCWSLNNLQPLWAKENLSKWAH